MAARLAAWLCLTVPVFACEPRDELAGLEREAAAVERAHQRELDALVSRVQALKRGLRDDSPGWENMFRVAEMANDELGLPPFTQRQPPGPGWKPSPGGLLGIGPYARERARTLARDHKRDDLAFLVADEQRRYVHGIAQIDRQLADVERWVASKR